MVVDLDGFKEVNDIRGHDAGDQVLQSIARRLESVVRASDTVARVGGDEFVVLSLGTRTEDGGGGSRRSAPHALRRPYRVDGGIVEIDASIGWALFPDDGATPEELLGRADVQMFATKRDSGDRSSASRRGSLDAGIVREFESALKQNEVVVHYQPSSTSASGAVQGVEALVRRLHPAARPAGPRRVHPACRADAADPRADAARDRRSARATARTLESAGRRSASRSTFRTARSTTRSSPTAFSASWRRPAYAPSCSRSRSSPPARAPVRSSTETVLQRLTRIGRPALARRLRPRLVARGASVLPLARSRSTPASSAGSGAADRTTRSSAASSQLARRARAGDGRRRASRRGTPGTRSPDLGCDRAQGFYPQPALPADELTDWLATAGLPSRSPANRTRRGAR